MTFPRLPQRCWFVVQVLSVCCIANADPSTSIQLQFLNSDDNSSVFENDTAKQRIVTDSDRVELQLDCSGETVPFLLFGVNGTNYPVFLENGKYSRTLELEQGETAIKASYKSNGCESIDRKIIRLFPGAVQSVQSRIVGESDAVELVNESDLFNDISSTCIPEISISGKSSPNQEVVLKVRDQFGSPLQVINEGDSFSVDYTLRDGENTLTFLYGFEGKVFAKEKLSFQLEQPVQLTVVENESTAGYLQQQASENHLVSQTLQVPIEGFVPGIAFGTVELSIGEATESIEVVDHRFSKEIDLEPSAITNIRVGASIADQSYFSKLDIQHDAAEFKLFSLKEGLLKRDRYELGKAIEVSTGETIVATSPVINIEGSSDYFGELKASITNTTTGESVHLGNSASKYSEQVALVEGENTIEFSVSNGVSTEVSKTLSIVFEQPLILKTVNAVPISDSNRISENELFQVSGNIGFVNDGRVQIKAGEMEHEVRVYDGQFASSMPHRLGAGDYEVEVYYQNGEQRFAQSFPLTVEEAKEVIQVADASPVTDGAPLPGDAVSGNSNAIFSNSQPITPTATEEVEANDVVVNEATSSNVTPDPSTIVEPEDGVYTPPKVLKARKPKTVRATGYSGPTIKGNAVFAFTVKKNGKVDKNSITVVESSDERLNKEGIRSLSKWVFEPATRGGVEIDTRTKITLRWN